MSTHSKPYWTISCDLCKKPLGNDNWEYTVFDTEGDAIGAAQDSDWKIFPDVQVCCWCVDDGKMPEGAHAEDPDDKGYCRWCGDEWPCEVVTPTEPADVLESTADNATEPSFIDFDPDKD